MCACAQDIEELIQTTTTGEIAAFMAEPILGVGGFIVPPDGYFETRYEIARQLRRTLYRRRSADRLGQNGRQMVRHRTMECHARHHDFRERNGERRSDRLDDCHAGSRRQISRFDLCDLRRKSGFDRRRARRYQNDRRRRFANKLQKSSAIICAKNSKN